MGSADPRLGSHASPGARRGVTEMEDYEVWLCSAKTMEVCQPKNHVRRFS
ncbi:hypothetical protein E2C01_100955 [Portunus trituberculatus]|uniref:Uncharacterized protein n=1 Tax=Portunus trituberculatus TaxID=210409 RepID=A0A5B7KEM9_PORTR|nr:hypothetical protein [Portunus trituberculatus]